MVSTRTKSTTTIDDMKIGLEDVLVKYYFDFSCCSTWQHAYKVSSAFFDKLFEEFPYLFEVEEN